jgi:glycosyltransferase, SP_1767 family
MINIFIFGTGESAEVVENNLISNNINVLGYLDNDRAKQGKKHNELPIVKPIEIFDFDFDYIIIATVRYDEVISQFHSIGVDSNKIIAFFSDEYIGKAKYFDIFKLDEWKNVAFSKKIDVALKNNEKILYAYVNNLEYEVADKIRQNAYKFPIIKSEEESIKKIIEGKCSISRFGDGEFEMIAERSRPKFQQPNHLLAVRLREVLNSNLHQHMIAIADNYGSLDKYESSAAMLIRKYLSTDVRKFHLELLDENKVYYNAYLSRPYVMYKDKKNAKNRFELIMKIWENRDVLIIEGDKTRMGVGNDLFINAKSIKRILAPSENAFSRYDEILKNALNIRKDTLILISLGPTATVLAYDLALAGYQAVDIGHIDIEYEWFLRGEGKKVLIKTKYVNEVPNGDIVDDINVDWYNNQIICKLY